MDGGNFVDVEHLFEEIEDLQELVERGPHWDTLIRCTITLNRPAENKHLTIEEAAKRVSARSEPNPAKRNATSMKRC